MIARLQQVSTLLVLGLASLWAIVVGLRGDSAAAMAGAALIAFGYALFLALEFALLVRYGSDIEALRPTCGQLLRAWFGEVLRTPLVFGWRQPFRSRAEPDHLPDDARGRRGVLLVHGFVCNRGIWNPWMRQLRAHSIPFVAVNLEPAFGSIDVYRQTLTSAYDRLVAATGEPPLVVAHSMGGLAVRAWLAGAAADPGDHPSDGAGGPAPRLWRIVTIATPHRGTWLARYALTRNGHEMKPEGPWLKALADREPRGAHEPFVCFYGHCDNIVFPTSTATLPGADNRHLPATAHVQMIYHPEIFAAVLALLRA